MPSGGFIDLLWRTVASLEVCPSLVGIQAGLRSPGGFNTPFLSVVSITLYCSTVLSRDSVTNLSACSQVRSTSLTCGPPIASRDWEKTPLLSVLLPREDLDAARQSRAPCDPFKKAKKEKPLVVRIVRDPTLSILGTHAHLGVPLSLFIMQTLASNQHGLNIA